MTTDQLQQVGCVQEKLDRSEDRHLRHLNGTAGVAELIDDMRICWNRLHKSDVNQLITAPFTS